MKRILPVVFTFVCLLPAPARPETVTLSADELIAQMTERLQTVESIRERGAWTFSLEQEGAEESHDTQLEFIYRKPDRLLLKSEHFIVSSDGATVSALLPGLNRYTRFEAKGNLQDSLEPLAPVIESIFPDKQALIAVDTGATLREKLRSAIIEVLADETLGDRPCWVVRLNMDEAAEDFPMPRFKAWIDQERAIIRRIESEPLEDVDLGEMAGVPEEMLEDLLDYLRNMRMAYEISQLDINTPLADELFVLEPGPDMELVEDLDALFDMPDMDFEEADTLPGNPAPDFEVTLLDGESLRLSELKGKVVVIDFWATWCGPCIRALPSMRELDEAFTDDELVIIGLSTDAPTMEEKVRRVVEQHELKYPVGIDRDDISDDYLVAAIPNLVVIDKEGVVRERKIGFAPGEMDAVRSLIRALIEE